MWYTRLIMFVYNIPFDQKQRLQPYRDTNIVGIQNISLPPPSTTQTLRIATAFMKYGHAWETFSRQSVKEFPVVYGTWRPISVFTTACHWTLSLPIWHYETNTLTYYSLINFNIISHLRIGLSSGPFLRLPIFFNKFLIFPFRTTYHTNFILNSIAPINNWQRARFLIM